MWRSTAAKAVGSSHAGRSRPCQDACGVFELHRDLLAIVVADGAGSAERSLEGADTAVHSALRYFRRRGDLSVADDPQWTSAVIAAIDAARESILDLAIQDGADAACFATTIQVVLVGPCGVAHGRVGDGGAVARIDDRLVAIARPPANTFVNETTFLTATSFQPEVSFFPGVVTDCAVFTDGLQPLALKLATWEPHLPFFAPLFEFVRQTSHDAPLDERVETFLRSAQVDRRTDDDRALAIAVWFDNER